MRILAAAPAVCLCMSLASLPGPQLARPARVTAAVLAALPAAGRNDYYVGNRAPLLPSPLMKLPVGSIQPSGWLRGQLLLMARGFSGNLEQISPWLKFQGSAWANPAGKGDNGWEELPYWLRGATDLGYVLKDKRVIADTRKWLVAILAGRRPDGYFGPEMNRANNDAWPNMLALYALRTYYEATGDQRVIDLMTGYFRWQLSLPRGRFLPESWQKFRGGDNLDSIYWLYNRTGARWLLDLARENHQQTADWTDGIPTWHGVNITEGFREPAEFYQQTADTGLLAATMHDYNRVMATYGQVPGGMFAADENCRPGYTGPRQAAETCSMVEFMHSDEMLTRITGSPVWADRCETVAFNSLPAAMTPDLKALHYLTAPDMIQLDAASKAPMLQNGDDMLSYNPYEYRCCQHNVAFGWPYFAERLWMATPANGLAAVLYGPCALRAKVGSGAVASITEETGYPFSDLIRLHLSLTRAAGFPLSLRIPGWCARPQLSLNGRAVALPASARGWIRLTRRWRTGDRIELKLPMTVRWRVWPEDGNAVSVFRGPLAYSLDIGERWRRYGDNPAWPAYEVFPTSPWNYALVAGSAKVVVRSGATPDQPFTPRAVPIELRVHARRVPQWTQEANGLIGMIPQSPVASAAPEETVTLIPMGAARLRVSVFPQATR